MRTSKLTIALFFSLCIPIANAEDMAYLLNSTPTERAASQTRFMQKKLNISQDEVAKIREINQEYAEKIEPVLKGSSIGFFKMRDIKAILEQKDDTLRSVLTPEQFDVYTNAKDELKQALRQDLIRPRVASTIDPLPVFSGSMENVVTVPPSSDERSCGNQTIRN